MGVQGQRRAAQKYLEKPERIFYTAGGIVVFGLLLGFVREQWNVALVVVGIGALYSLLYIPWKIKHNKEYGQAKKNNGTFYDNQNNDDEWF